MANGARARRVRRQRRAAAAARLPRRGAGRAGAAAAHPRRRPREHPRRPARQRADERAVGRACSSSSRPASRRFFTTPAAIGTCSGCSRTCSARTRWASATCCSSPAIRRRSATTRTRPAVFDVDSIGLTNVVDAPESRARHRRAEHRRADGVPHRRRRESRRARSGRGSAPLRVQGRGGRRVRDHAAGVRRARARAVPGAHRRLPDSDARGLVPLESLRHAEFMANEVPGVRVPEAVVERMRARRSERARRR